MVMCHFGWKRGFCIPFGEMVVIRFFLINKWIYGQYDEDVKGFPNGAFYIDWGTPFLEMVDPSFYGKK